MNVAKVLSERMKSPGALAELRDRTSNPAALSQVGDAKTGSDKQEPWPLDPGDEVEWGQDGDGDDSAVDGGLGMLESAHAHAHGDRKADYHKALEHAHAKREAKMEGYKKRGSPKQQAERMGGQYDHQRNDFHSGKAKGRGLGMAGEEHDAHERPYESRESRAGGMPGKGIFKRSGT